MATKKNVSAAVVEEVQAPVAPVVFGEGGDPVNPSADPGAQTGSGEGSGTQPGEGSGTQPGEGSGTQPGEGSGTQPVHNQVKVQVHNQVKVMKHLTYVTVVRKLQVVQFKVQIFRQ